MRRRGLGLALMSLALLLPGAADQAAVKQARAVEDYKVLVVTSAQDEVTAAGVAAIQSVAASGGFTVTAPSPATVGAEFTPANLDQYGAVVFLPPVWPARSTTPSATPSRPTSATAAASSASARRSRPTRRGRS